MGRGVLPADQRRRAGRGGSLAGGGAGVSAGMRPTGEEPPEALGAAVGRMWRAGPDGASGEPGLRLS